MPLTKKKKNTKKKQLQYNKHLQTFFKWKFLKILKKKKFKDKESVLKKKKRYQLTTLRRAFPLPHQKALMLFTTQQLQVK